MDARLSPCAKCLRQMGLALDCANRLKMAAQFATLNSHRSRDYVHRTPRDNRLLRKLDNEWPKSKRLLAIPEQREFIVTTSAAFYRREVLRYLNEILPAYAPTKRKVILYPDARESSRAAKRELEAAKRSKAKRDALTLARACRAMRSATR